MTMVVVVFTIKNLSSVSPFVKLHRLHDQENHQHDSVHVHGVLK